MICLLFPDKDARSACNRRLSSLAMPFVNTIKGISFKGFLRLPRSAYICANSSARNGNVSLLRVDPQSGRDMAQRRIFCRSGGSLLYGASNGEPVPDDAPI